MLDLKSFDEDKKRDIAFQTVVAMRDTIAIAKKIGYKPTYENSIQLFHDFSPELYEDIINSLKQRNISDDAKIYIVESEVRSSNSGTKITPIDVLKEDIEKYKTLLESKKVNNENSTLLKGKIRNLESLKKSLLPRKLSENRILQRDYSKIDRTDFGAQFIEGNDFYVDYLLKGGKYLRIRLLHPDEPEHITGADLIYEQHDVKNGLIRILFLQYKIWENGVLYFSQAKNLENQLKRMKECLCSQGFCEGPYIEEEDRALVGYRFPHCCAFLRPTDKLQEQNEKLISSGIHIPICAVERIKEVEGGKIDRKYIRHQALNQDVFEHLYNKNFIGSRWLKYDEVEAFYNKNKILDNDESIILYAREIKEHED